MSGCGCTWLALVFMFATRRSTAAPPVEERALLKALDSLDDHQLAGVETVLGMKEEKKTPVVEPSADYMGDVMMGDMPVVDSSSKEIAAPDSMDDIVKSDRERDKRRRIISIKSTLLKILRGGQDSPEVGEHHRRIISVLQDRLPITPGNFQTDVYTEKVQSFYPSCEVPRNTDEEMWTGSEVMNLLFRLNVAQPPPTSTLTINYATLRLYKINKDKGENSSGFKSDFGGEKRVRVSVFWYIRSLKKNKVKRKLLDSQMILVGGEEWTEWDVRTAAQSWLDTGRNFGMSIQVEDEDGSLLPTTDFFMPMNCSKEASTQRPIPGFILEAARRSSSNFKYESYLLPMMDICTVESPQSAIPARPHRHHHGSRIPRDSIEQISWQDGGSNNSDLLPSLPL